MYFRSCMISLTSPNDTRMYYADRGQPLTTADEELDDLDHDLSDLSVRGYVDHDLFDLSDIMIYLICQR